MPAGWRAARLVERSELGAGGRTLVFTAPGWPGHLPGQHIDVRLTAEDGYQAVRSYSLAAPAEADRLELGVQPVLKGEVSPYLAEGLPLGSEVEIRGPLGGWFLWRPEQTDPLLLLAGGSGIAPLMAMVRAHRRTGSPAPLRLVYSVREPRQVWYGPELEEVGEAASIVYTRLAAPGRGRPAGRLGPADLNPLGLGPEDAPLCFVCGPTGFVEHTADLLTGAGHAPARIRTERFG